MGRCGLILFADNAHSLTHEHSLSYDTHSSTHPLTIHVLPLFLSGVSFLSRSYNPPSHYILHTLSLHNTLPLTTNYPPSHYICPPTIPSRRFLSYPLILHPPSHYIPPTLPQLLSGASYLDDIVWRVVSRLLNDILSTNKLSLTFNVLGAAANQTASVVREVAGTYLPLYPNLTHPTLSYFNLLYPTLTYLTLP